MRLMHGGRPEQDDLCTVLLDTLLGGFLQQWENRVFLAFQQSLIVRIDVD